MNTGWKIESNDQDFDRDVMQRSETTPVLVDFWATWCAPCRMLAPILDDVCQARAGKLVLAKVETEQAPQAATHFGVRSIPAVFLVHQRNIVDGFAGIMPQRELERWIDRHLDRLQVAAIEQLEASDPSLAKQRYQEVLAQRNDDQVALLGVARLGLQSGDLETARDAIERLERRGFLEPEAKRVKARLELAASADQDADEIERCAIASPQDLEAQLAWARILIGRAAYVSGLERCLDIIERRPGKQTLEAAKRLMLDTFQVWDDEEQVRSFRRRLSNLLY